MTDESTLMPAAPTAASTPSDRVELTLLAHADPRRIGERWVGSPGSPVAISRSSPTFSTPAGGTIGPLEDRCISRRDTVLRWTGGGARLEPGPGVRVDAAPCTSPLTLTEDRLRTGVILTLADRAVVALRLAREGPRTGLSLGLVGHAAALEAVRVAAVRAAPLDVPVLVVGETGTGKELVARALHDRSPRAGRPFVAINAGALSPSTAGAELFGHARGAFTGADRRSPGLFGRAEGGTLFLDEIGELPDAVQPLLLRALQDGAIQPVGDAPRRVDVRIVAATDADLEARVTAGSFRAPLLHRLRGVVVRLPPLRARREDIGRLLVHFLRDELGALGATHLLDPAEGAARPWLSARCVEALALRPWPGNVRELQHAARRLALEGFDQAEAPTGPPPDAAPPEPDADGDWEAVLARHQYRLGPASAALGISRNTLNAWIDRHDTLTRPRDLDAGRIRDALRAAGDVDAAARALRVSARGLRLRMTALGVDP